MSSVRMCDRCGTVFSELAEGWQAYSANTFKRDDDGRRITVSVMMDACPSCAIDAEPPPVRDADAGFFEREELRNRVLELEAVVRNRDAEKNPGPTVEPDGAEPATWPDE